MQIGGVVCRSPLIAIAAYEREHTIPHDYINCSMSVLPVRAALPNPPTRLSFGRVSFPRRWDVSTLTDVPFLSIGHISIRRGANGAWQRFERGEIELWDFYVAFGHELSDTALGNAWYREYCAQKGIGERSLFDSWSSFPLSPTCIHFDPS